MMLSARRLSSHDSKPRPESMCILDVWLFIASFGTTERFGRSIPGLINHPHIIEACSHVTQANYHTMSMIQFTDLLYPRQQKVMCGIEVTSVHCMQTRTIHIVAKKFWGESVTAYSSAGRSGHERTSGAQPQPGGR